MANHIRRQVRDAVAVLVTGLTTTGANVFTRVGPLQPHELPALRLRTEQDEVEVETISFPEQQTRRIRLVVDVIAAQADDVQNTLDQICLEVEKAINASSSSNRLGGLSAGGVSLISTEIDIDGDGSVDVGRASMNFDVHCIVNSDAPDVVA